MGLWDELECEIVAPNVFQRAVQAAAAQRPVSRVLGRIHQPLDRAVAGLSGGRVSATRPLAGLVR